MRFFKLVTLDRRGGNQFILRDENGRNVIGLMKLNGQTARHELELSEEEFLRHSKSLAKLCRIPGCAVYVESIREVIEQPKRDTVREKLEKIARDEGIDISHCQTNEQRRTAIKAAAVPA